NVVSLSDFKAGQFGADYGLNMTDGALAGLHSRVIVVVDENGKVVYTEQVPEIAQEPNYDEALASLS
ncbi:MAG: redoxin family protein, partial [Flavobacterium sp.]